VRLENFKNKGYTLTMTIPFQSFLKWLQSKWSDEFNNPKYYGKIVIEIQAGEIVRFESTQSFQKL